MKPEGGTPIPYTGPSTIVTAADEAYFDRMANLIGSVQYWTPSTQIRVYDIGLSPSSRLLATSWSNVTIITPPWDTLPPHFNNPALVAYKAWCMIDTMNEVQERSPVLWLDANTEVRQQLDYVFSAIHETGHFFTLAGHKFPTFRTVRLATLEFLNAQEELLVNEKTSAVMGFSAGTDFGREILGKMNWCAMQLKVSLH